MQKVKTFSHFVCSDFVIQSFELWKLEQVNKIYFSSTCLEVLKISMFIRNLYVDQKY